ncbi:MAG TPA: restriction endonuclease [Phycisphaerae bacterium]|nr:restriction endonuclease [Phycisphaerae bacterium]
MPREIPPVELSPQQFELEVKKVLEAGGAKLDSFRAAHRQVLHGAEGEYEIDVAVWFEAMGAEFLVLVECKHQKSSIKRDVVQVLADRVRSIGAHKGIVFATAPFQSGALEYAKQHGIGLVRIADGSTAWETRAFGATSDPPSWANIPPYVGWLVQLTEQGLEQHSLVDVRHPEALIGFLAGPVSPHERGGIPG